jgi:hypothetical protein
MGQVSGKAGGYYGCLGGAKRACANRLLVTRKLIERRVVTALRDRIAEPQVLASVLVRVEENVKQLLAHVPQQIKEKRVALASEERRVANFVEFIGEGKGTRALTTALSEAERRVETLRAELELLTSTASAMFQAPPVEWIARRVDALAETLARDTTRSALVLREALGPITLRPLIPEVGRQYYQAKTSLQVLNLLQDPDDGSNSLRKWTRGESNRPRGYSGEGESNIFWPLTTAGIPTTTLLYLQLVPRGHVSSCLFEVGVGRHVDDTSPGLGLTRIPKSNTLRLTTKLRPRPSWAECPPCWDPGPRARATPAGGLPEAGRGHAARRQRIERAPWCRESLAGGPNQSTIPPTMEF